MWPDSLRRANEIRKTSKVFNDRGYTNTSKYMNSIAQDIISKQISNIDKKFIHTTKVFREEFIHEDRELGDLFDFMLETMVKPVIVDKISFRNKLTELNPWRVAYAKKVEMLAEFTQYLFRKKW